MEDQTKNRIREEKLNTLKSMLWELGHTNKDAHHVIEYADELLKSQREELVKKIEKHQNFITMSDYDVGYNDCKENIINLIKNN